MKIRFLCLLTLAASVSAAAPSSIDKWESSNFSLLPKSFQRDPHLMVLINTEFTAAGRKAPQANQSYDELGTLYEMDDPDLTAFRAHSGKLILTHGLADNIVPPEGTIDYYLSVQRRMGAAAVADFVRLFLVPGENHGTHPQPNGAPVPRPSELARDIVAWVEQGTPPNRLATEWRDPAGKLVRTRVVFPYPQKARYQGTGSRDEASSYVSDR